MFKLRELVKDDMVIINRWRNNPELVQWLCTPFRYINLDVDEAWFDFYMKSRDHEVRCAILREEDHALIGCIYLLDIDWINRSANLGIMIGESNNRGQGAGSYALNTILDHAFFNLGLHRVQLEAIEENERAIRLYEHFGFRREGILEDKLFKNGRYVNTVIMAVLSETYVDRRKY